MNKFLEHAFQLEDKQRGYTVYRHGKPAYQRKPQTDIPAAWLVLAAVAFGVLLSIAMYR